MMRKYVDCRDVPSEMICTVAIAADSDEELLEAAAQHAVTVHRHSDSPSSVANYSRPSKKALRQSRLSVRNRPKVV